MSLLAFQSIFSNTEAMIRRFIKVLLLLPVFGVAHSSDVLSISPEVILECEGDATTGKALTKVYIKKDGGKYFIRFPMSLNLESPVSKVFGGEVLTVLGSVSDTGAGFWVINTLTKKYSYMQTKEISKYSNVPFNADQYLGSCNVVSGSIKDF